MIQLADRMEHVHSDIRNGEHGIFSAEPLKIFYQNRGPAAFRIVAPNT